MPDRALRALVFVLALAIVPPQAVAQERAAGESGPERAALAESKVSQREQQSGRPFDPTIRSIILASLARRPADALRALKLEPAPLNVGDTTADLTFTPLSPCRIVDTRLGGGALTAGTPRSFLVAGTAGFTTQGGTSGGCGVPVGATSVLINFTAVNPQGLGNLKGSAYPNAIPATGSIVNYQSLTPTLNIANGLAFPICDPSATTCTFDMTLLANVSGTDVVADVLGYFSRFKKEQVRSFTNGIDYVSGGVITSTCQNTGNVSISLTAPVSGSFQVHSNLVLQVNRSGSAGMSTEYDMVLSLTPGDCVGVFTGRHQTFYEPIAATATIFRPISLDMFGSIAAGSTLTFYVNSRALQVVSGDTGSIGGDTISVTFYPD